MLPTFVYLPEYSRVAKRRLPYILGKTILVLGGLMKAYQIVANHILEHVFDYGKGSITFEEMYMRVVLPIGILIILLIFIGSDFISNLAAEISRYPDHQSYEDFWNSRTMKEFMKRSSSLVTNFFKAHVICELVSKFGLRYSYAKLISSALSILLIEGIMV